MDVVKRRQAKQEKGSKNSEMSRVKNEEIIGIWGDDGKGGLLWKRLA